MKRAAMLVILGTSASAASAAPEIAGNWLTSDKAAIVSIAPRGRHMCGKVAKVLVNRPGVPRTDVHNPDPALRTRAIEGMRIITGLTAHGEQWDNGRIYDPKSGKSYRSRIQLDGDGSLEVAGCIAFFCQTQRWTRLR